MRIRRPSAVFLTSALLLTGCSSERRAPIGPGAPPNSPAPTGSRTEASAVVPSASGSMAVVHITTLRSGQTISLPATIGYTISGLRFNATAGYRLHVQVDDPGSYSLDLPISGSAGTVELPRDKMLPGTRDLIISLTRTDVTPARPAQRAAHLNDVTIYGPK